MPRELNKLAASVPRGAKPREAPYKLADGGGLYLLVHPDGARYWRLNYRFAGKHKTLALGTFPDVTLKGARDGRDKARKLLQDGVDPSRAKREEKRQKRIRQRDSFEAIAREWHENQRAKWKARHAGQVLSSLETDAFPTLGVRPIAEISAAEILDTIREIEGRGAVDLAGRVLQRVSAVFRYAIATNRARSNPAGDLKGALKVPEKSSMSALAEDELPGFIRRLESYDGYLQTKLGLWLLLYTFVRTGEMRFARWSEFNFDKREWVIPAERMKNKLPHWVPLSAPVVRVLDELRPLSERFELLFPGRSDPRKPVSENTWLYAIYRMGYHSRATTHGFRATASTILHESRLFLPDAIERQLAHVEGNRVKAAYDRSKHHDERRRMMEWWGDYIDRLRDR